MRCLSDAEAYPTTQEMRKVTWLSLYASQSAVTHAVTTEHVEGMHGLPALTDNVTNMVARGQMIGHCYSEDF